MVEIGVAALLVEPSSQFRASVCLINTFNWIQYEQEIPHYDKLILRMNCGSHFVVDLILVVDLDLVVDLITVVNLYQESTQH